MELPDDYQDNSQVRISAQLLLIKISSPVAPPTIYHTLRGLLRNVDWKHSKFRTPEQVNWEKEKKNPGVSSKEFVIW